MNLIFFPSPSDFRKWLEANYMNENELWVGFYKVNSSKPSLTWSQSVDEALCFGWIDGLRKSIDAESYRIRFTPRKSSSNWSAVNIAKVEKLIKEGKMLPEGLAIFENRKIEKSNTYSFESAKKDFSNNFEEKFRSHKKAWEFFNKQAPSYKKTTIRWLMSAKQENTKLNRFHKLITACNENRRLW